MTLKTKILNKFKTLNWLIQHKWESLSPKIKSDELYIRVLYLIRMHRFLHLRNPKTFNEKLQWLKLYAHKPEYVIMADKVKAKEYVAERIGSEHIIPTLGIWRTADDVDFSSLPNQFVIKCNHNSGQGMFICKDKIKMDEELVRNELRKGLAYNYFWPGRDKQYRDIPRRILAEQFMIDNKIGELRDYKFFCFNGVVKFFKVDFERFINHHANYYDIDGKLLLFGENVCPPDYSKQIFLPETIKEMIGYAEILSKSIPFVRVDFYDVNGKVYFGEMTFFPAAGMGAFKPRRYDKILGKYINLPLQ